MQRGGYCWKSLTMTWLHMLSPTATQRPPRQRKHQTKKKNLGCARQWHSARAYPLCEGMRGTSQKEARQTKRKWSSAAGKSCSSNYKRQWNILCPCTSQQTAWTCTFAWRGAIPWESSWRPLWSLHATCHARQQWCWIGGLAFLGNVCDNSWNRQIHSSSLLPPKTETMDGEENRGCQYQHWARFCTR